MVDVVQPNLHGRMPLIVSVPVKKRLRCLQFLRDTKNKMKINLVGMGLYMAFMMSFVSLASYSFGRVHQAEACRPHKTTKFIPGDVLDHKLFWYKAVVIHNQEGPMMTIRWTTHDYNKAAYDRNALEAEWSLVKEK